MITIEQKKAQTAHGKVRCETCPKTLHLEDTNEDQIGEEAIQFLMATASRHERLHPTHKLEVSIYERTPLQNS